MPQDLDALAAQLGGQPVGDDDLDALAAQLGGQPVTQPAPMAPVSSHAPEAAQRRKASACAFSRASAVGSPGKA